MNQSTPSTKPIAIWLLIGVGMLIIQIILGGITRLTGSGLSITEWDIITGTLPPLDEKGWLVEFKKYRQTSQYRLLNADFKLSDFKFIFFWEWLHRFWARLIGVVFLIPFISFLIQRRFRQNMIGPLIILFLLGAMQGAVGWIMVASGLQGDAIYVKPTRLALHFIFAMVLLCYTFWFGLKLLIKEKSYIHAPFLKKITIAIIALLAVQFIFGALMAGHKAAPAAPTWPDINGSFIPSYVFNRPEGLRSLIENPVVIHFVHRMLAYLLVIAIVIWSIRAFRIQGFELFARVRIWPLAFVLLQLLLGILTVLTSLNIQATRWNVFEWMAQLHQVVALLLLLSLILVLFLQRKKFVKQTSSIDTPVF
ncbi:MAG TPA: COX15/CtaA family protein [Chitinophagaceae bacterium]|nr:COX15/CtaA family protein [Chitinophagaceae bacterium]